MDHHLESVGRKPI